MDLQGLEDKTIFRSQENLYEMIVQSIPHLAWVADEEGNIFWWNQKWFEYTGTTEMDMQKEGWRKVHHPHHWERVNQGFQHAVRNGQPWEDTFPLSNGRGGWYWFLARAVPVNNGNGEIRNWIGTLTDINDRKRQEDELKRSRSNLEGSLATKIDLLMNMSREIRTPMNTILGFAGLLKDSSLSAQEREQFADRIISNGDQLLQMIDDILNLSKFESDKSTVEPVRFNISDMVFDIVQAMNPVADKKDVKIMVFFHTAIPEVITSDPHKVRQIMTHLLGNAIKYTESGGRILVFLEFQKETKHGPSLLIDVEDTGIGISREQQRKIFQPFAQLESVNSQDGSGSGRRLGLALSQKLADSLGGNLTLKGSEIGKGSCFTLSIPTGDITDVEFIKGKKSVPFARKFLSSIRKTKRLENVRVLLAEDSEDNETLIRLYLEKEGAIITYAHNGLEVLDYVKNQDFDIILMDIQMPLLDGLEATRQLRQKHFQKPIVALTAHALKGDIEKSLKAGCDTHLTKPIRGEVLIEEIQKRVFH